jgi:RNA exonuclease 4
VTADNWRNTARAGLVTMAAVPCRVCVVNSAGHVLLDSFVRPQERVTDFRTSVSGVRWSDLRDAPSFHAVQQQVGDLLRGRILVGHALINDLEVGYRCCPVLHISALCLMSRLDVLVQVLQLSHPKSDVRDTAKYPPLMKSQVRGIN